MFPWVGWSWGRRGERYLRRGVSAPGPCPSVCPGGSGHWGFTPRCWLCPVNLAACSLVLLSQGNAGGRSQALGSERPDLNPGFSAYHLCDPGLVIQLQEVVRIAEIRVASAWHVAGDPRVLPRAPPPGPLTCLPLPRHLPQPSPAAHLFPPPLPRSLSW